jgi:hypothetical protein
MNLVSNTAKDIVSDVELPVPRYIDIEMVADKIGSTGVWLLKRDVFERAYTHLKKDATPGFPYIDYSTVADVPRDVLYRDVCYLLNVVENIDFSSDYMNCPESIMFGLSSGFYFPAKMFVKGEPTKVTKVARLIYGVGLVMNLFNRIFFGDYMQELSNSWDKTCHKIGIDFESEDGLRRYEGFLEQIKLEAQRTGRIFVQDDIQGWEYMAQPVLYEAMLEAYRSKADPEDDSSLLRNLMNYLVWHYRTTMVLDSDNVLHVLPIAILPSGDPKTHWLNTMMRILVATIDSRERYSKSCCQANGDDCGLLTDITNLDYKQWFSSKVLGMVHTDVSYGFSVVDFCSNYFTQTPSGLKRVPRNVAKMLYSLLSATSDTQVIGILKHLRLVDDFPTLLKAYNLHRLLKGEAIIE